jgi:hypothetical protein
MNTKLGAWCGGAAILLILLLVLIHGCGSRQKWEYTWTGENLTLRFPPPNAHVAGGFATYQDNLHGTPAGDDGWELVSVFINRRGEEVFYFKRPK